MPHLYAGGLLEKTMRFCCYVGRNVHVNVVGVVVLPVICCFLRKVSK